MGLFAYWFRYTCVLILQNGSDPEVAVRVAATIRLNYLRVREQLENGPAAALEPCFEALEQDYRILTELLPRQAGLDRAERSLLVLDYSLMRLVYFCSQRLQRVPGSRRALLEMSSILNCFATSVGQPAR